jgi:O-antigen ligase
MALCVAILALITGHGAFFELIGRNENLTGRDFLFAVFPRFFTERPVFGYGFNGFFTGEPGAPAQQLWELAPWHHKFPTFESSYLEILIQFGIVGGLCFAAIILCALRNSWRFARTSNSAYRYAPFGIMIFILSSSLSETYLTLQNYIYVVLLFWIYFGIELRPSKISKGNRSPPNFAREPVRAGPWIRRRNSRLRSGGVVRPRVAE